MCPTEKNTLKFQVVQIESTHTNSFKFLLFPVDGPGLPAIMAPECQITTQLSAISDTGLHQQHRHEAMNIKALMLWGMKERRKEKGDPN
jgi:hypothetical protein